MPPAPRPFAPRALNRRPAATALVAALALTAGCTGPQPSAVDALPAQASAQTMLLATTKDLMEAPVDPTVAPAHSAVSAALAVAPPRLTGRGFAQVAGQPGATVNERRLLAMRAARLDALRDLTEQVHGIRITSESLLRDSVLRNDTLAAQVQGTLRGARTVAIEPRGDDGYAVTLELDADTVAYVLRAVRGGA